jgi:hypothetical protein
VFIMLQRKTTGTHDGWLRFGTGQIILARDHQPPSLQLHCYNNSTKHLKEFGHSKLTGIDWILRSHFSLLWERWCIRAVLVWRMLFELVYQTERETRSHPKRSDHIHELEKTNQIINKFFVVKQRAFHNFCGYHSIHSITKCLLYY